MKYLFVIFTLFLFGCDKSKELIENSVYVKDTSTGFCFCAFYLNKNVAGISYVPCVDSVNYKLFKSN